MDLMVNRIRIAVLPLALFCAAATALRATPAQADDTYTFVVKKQEAKAAHRWTIQDWLETRDKLRLMDLWLALHSPSPYEFYLGGAYMLGNQTGGGTYSAPSFSLAAYDLIFGLGLERESGLGTRYDGTFHLRFFGLHYQATHMRAEIGIRHESVGNLSYQNAIAGLGLTIYMAKPFGIDARWRHAFASTPNAAGLDFAGDRFEGGAFLDFSFVRVYGQYVYEKLAFDPATLAADGVRSGPQAGLKLFF